MNISTGIAITLFAPLLAAAFFSLLSGWLSARNAKKIAHYQSDLAAKMKLADFRQAWINDLRNSLADLQARGIQPGDQASDKRELSRIAIKIRLIMNRKDSNYPNLNDLIDRLVANAGQSGGAQIVQELTPLSQDILKKEWEVLKDDLNYNTRVKNLL